MLSLFGLSKLYIRAFYALICYHTFWNEDYLYRIKWLVGGNFVNLSLCPTLSWRHFFNRWSLRPSAHQCVHPTITRMTDRSTNWPPVRPSARPKGYPGIFSLKYGMLMCPVYLQSSLYILYTVCRFSLFWRHFDWVQMAIFEDSRYFLRDACDWMSKGKRSHISESVV